MTNKERIEKAKEYAVKNELLNVQQADGIIDFIKNNKLLYTDGNGDYVNDQKMMDRILLEQFGILLLILSGNCKKDDPLGFSIWLNDARIDEDEITDETTVFCLWDTEYGISEDFDYIPYMGGASGGAIAVYDYTEDNERCEDWPDEEAFEYGKRLADFLANLYGVKKKIEELPEAEKEKVVQKHLDELLNAFGRDVEECGGHGIDENTVTYAEVTYRSLDGKDCKVRNRVRVYDDDAIAQIMYFIDFVCECEQIGYIDIKYIELEYDP